MESSPTASSGHKKQPNTLCHFIVSWKWLAHSGDPGTMDSEYDVDSMGVKDLKALITKSGLSFKDCPEKDDLKVPKRST